MITRPHFHSSEFVRVLADLAVAQADRSRESFAERLAQWIPIADAISLRATHSVGASGQSNAAAQTVIEAVEAHYQRVRNALAEAFNPAAPSHASQAAQSRHAMPRPKAGTAIELAGAYEPYRRFYMAHQREMELKLKPLRAKLREVIAPVSPALKQLAALDAAFDGILAEREAMLFAKVPSLLEKRFKHLRTEHQQRLHALQQEDTVDLWTKPGGWLTRFSNDALTVLTAELDVRLQPTLGLLEALRSHHTEKI